MKTNHIFKTTFCLFFLLICATQSTLSQDAEFYVKKGKEALSKNSLNKANEYFQKATKLSASDPEIYFEIGDAFNSYYPRHYKNYYIYSKASTDLALKYYLKAIEYKPLFKKAMLEVGDCYNFKKMFTEALRYYTEALQLDTTDISALERLGDFYIEQKDTIRAIEYYEEGGNHGDLFQKVSVYEKLGLIYFNMGEYNKAIDWLLLQAANEQNHLAKCYLMLGDTVRALEYLNGAYETYLPKDERSDFLEDFARIEFLRGDCGNAIKHYRELIELRPSESQYYFDLGKVYEKMGNAERQEYFCKIAAKMGNKGAKEYLRRK
jgi:tetratricopeptide (TPR) repeat protein